MKVTPKNRRILVRKCVNDHVRAEDGEVQIYKPDEVYETTNVCEIIDIADDCRIFRREHIGWFLELPEWIEGLDLFDEEMELWFVKETILDDVIETGAVFKED